jgi:predicted membrane protein
MKTIIKTKDNVFKIENFFGVLLAIGILFQITPDSDFANVLNTSTGIVLSLILVVILFMTMNPIVGFLLLIYIYQILQKATTYYPNNRYELLKKMNAPLDTQMEEDIISKMAPIKNQYRDSITSFEPVLTK